MYSQGTSEEDLGLNTKESPRMSGSKRGEYMGSQGGEHL